MVWGNIVRSSSDLPMNFPQGVVLLILRVLHVVIDERQLGDDFRKILYLWYNSREVGYLPTVFQQSAFCGGWIDVEQHRWCMKIGCVCIFPVNEMNVEIVIVGRRYTNIKTSNVCFAWCTVQYIDTWYVSFTWVLVWSTTPGRIS